MQARIHTHRDFFMPVDFSVSLVLIKMNNCSGNSENTEDLKQSAGLFHVILMK